MSIQNYFLTLLVTIIFPAIGLCQTEPKRQAIYLEGFGAGVFYSFNYDWRFRDQSDGLGAKAGLGYTAIDGYRVTTVPIAVNYLIGNKKNFLELGLGGTLLLVNHYNSTFASSDPRFSGSAFYFNGIIGYRRVAESGFVLRAGFTPFFTGEEGVFFPQLSLGYAF
ncbi:hypothetical protein ACFSKL_00975 [Belliella marina]|uniref:Outer membrane protein beta-barrel domain-containing protein n=1 Tax=Belliella marina TaxID=1644146 RepID=A0ABW4VHR6_9BACT